MKKKQCICLSILAATITATTIVALVYGNEFIPGKGGDEDIRFVFNKTKNKYNETSEYSSGDKNDIKTNRGNNYSFHFDNVKNLADGWQTIGGGGSFDNRDKKIPGISSISITLKEATTSPICIYYSPTSSFEEASCIHVEFSEATPLSSTVDLSDYHPNFFKLSNLSETDVSFESITVDFACAFFYSNVNVTSENEEYGKVYSSLPNGTYPIGTEFTITAVSKVGYTFSRWENTISGESKYTPILTFTTTEDDIAYKAIFTEVILGTIKNRVVIDSTGEHGTYSCPTEYEYDPEKPETATVTLKATPETDYTCKWFDMDGNCLSSNTTFDVDVTNMGDIVFKLIFDKGVTVNAVSNNVDYGTTEGGGAYYPGTKVTLTANAKPGYAFFGWYSDANYENTITPSETYTFTLGDTTATYYAKFITEAEKTKWNKEQGLIPVINEDGKTATYGIYPRLHVSNVTLPELWKLPDISEFFNSKFYHGNFLKIVVSNQFSRAYWREDPTAEIHHGSSYVIGLEPIKWNIVEHTEDTDFDYYVLDSEEIIDAHLYNDFYKETQKRKRFDSEEEMDVYSNNYPFSSIREYLNTNFVEHAFQTRDEYLMKSTVAHDKSTTERKDGENPYAVDYTTEDYAYLSCYRDWNSGSIDKAVKLATDFAMLCGTQVYCSSTQADYYKGIYWLRSPSPSSYMSAGINDIDIFGRTKSVSSYYCGIAPRIKIKIAKAS